MVLTSLFAALIVIMAFTPLGYIPLVIINATIIHIPVIIGSLYCGPKRGAFLGFVFGATSFLKNTLMATSLSAFVFSPVLAFSVAGPIGILESTIICFVPRILVGVVPFYVFQVIQSHLSGSHRKTAKLICDLVLSLIVALASYTALYKILTDHVQANAVSVAVTTACLLGLAVFLILTFALGSQSGSMLSFVYAGLSGALTNTLLVMPMIYLFYKNAYAAALSIEPSAVMGVILGVISFNGVLEALVAAVLVSAVGLALNRYQSKA